jgi:transcriptional regulator with XRE-family HTH domain
MILPIQIRSARALLGLSQQDLAKQARVSLGTVKRIELAETEVGATVKTMMLIQRALERSGVLFIEQDDRGGPGVRLREPLRESE